MSVGEEGVWRVDIQALADAVADDPNGIDAAWDRLEERYPSHIKRNQGRTSRDFLQAALHDADGRRLLGAFAVELVKEGLVSPDFVERVRNYRRPGPVAPQAVHNLVHLNVDALIASRGLALACENVCRIDVGGKQAGTGVLVRPMLVATAAHVLGELVRRTSDGRLEARPGSIGQLTLTFGYAWDYVKGTNAKERRAGVTVKLHADWLAGGSPQSLGEESRSLLDVNDITGIDPEKGPWDLAVIRLAEVRALPEPALVDSEPQSGPFQIHLLHHPNDQTLLGAPLQWSIGQLDSQLGTQDPRLGKRPVRYLHDAPTSPGSSGAPVFDSSWRVVALHQAGSKSWQSAAAAVTARGTGADRNRAVPVLPWRGQLDAMVGTAAEVVLRSAQDVLPYLRYPVIGRRKTQRRVWQAMAPGAGPAQRLLIIRGEPGTGLRFTRELVRRLGGAAGHGAVEALDMVNALADNADQLARRLAGLRSGRLTGPVHEEGLTTAIRDIRNDIAPQLARVVVQHDPGPVWLVLEGFDGIGAHAQQAGHSLVHNLIGELPHVPALRLVLVGWLDTPPAGYETAVETLAPPTGEDIIFSLTPPGDALIDSYVRVAADALSRQRSCYDSAQDVARRLAALLRVDLHGTEERG